MLGDAIADLKGEVLKGETAEAAVAQVAADYGLNPALLLRKFRESFPTDEGIRATQAVLCDGLTNSLAARVAKDCKRYGVPVEATRVVTIGGRKFTVICRLPARTTHPLVAVCHQTLKPMYVRLPGH